MGRSDLTDRTPTGCAAGRCNHAAGVTRRASVWSSSNRTAGAFGRSFVLAGNLGRDTVCPTDLSTPNPPSAGPLREAVALASALELHA